jgi:hypothetical protein
MNARIRFEIVESGVGIPQPMLDIEVIDHADFLEKQILIGTSVQLDGKSYKIINREAEPNREGNIVFYLQCMN